MANGKNNGNKKANTQNLISKRIRNTKSVRLSESGERIIKPKGVTKPKPTKNTTPVRKSKPKTNTQKLREAKKTLKSVKTNRKLEKKVLKSERTAGYKLSRINNKIKKQTNRRVRTARRLE